MSTFLQKIISSNLRKPTKLPILRRRGLEVVSRRSLASSSGTSSSNMASPRRRRNGYTTIPETAVRSQLLGLSEAYTPKEENVDDYLAKTSLSPWVPLPDSACRAMLDLVQMNETDTHVDLGSGDGRVNFWAADGAKVKWTLGVDVDEGILQVARDRLAKRHPLPENIQFVQVDLLKDLENPVWDRIREATVISMFFATPALRLFRPVLEEQLRGRSCKIVTAGYPMPGWQHPWQTTVVLGTTLHYYRWGEKWEEEMDDESVENFLADDFVLPEATRNALETDRFRGSKVIDRTTGRNLVKQYMERFGEDSEDDADNLFEDDDEDNDEKDVDEKQVQKKSTKKKSSCKKKSKAASS